MKNTEELVAIILSMSSRYIASAQHLQQDEQYFYSELFLASQTVKNPPSVGNSALRLNNVMFLIADKINDIPTWFYLNNPLVRKEQSSSGALTQQLTQVR